MQEETHIHYSGFTDFCNSAVGGFVPAGFRFPLLSVGETTLLEDSAQLGLAPMQLAVTFLFHMGLATWSPVLLLYSV